MNAILKAFVSRRMAVVLLLGFSSGIPLGLTGAALQAWYKASAIDIATIGILSLATLPYALKFFWSPFMDRFSFPLLGKRRGWMLLTQVLLVIGILSMSRVDPATHRYLLGLTALIVAFFSASQDIVLDAYRTEILTENELGPGSSLWVTGYRVGMVVSGALPLILVDPQWFAASWPTVYVIMAGSMLIGIVASFLAPEPQLGLAAPKTLKEAVILPLAEFLRRRGAVEMLVFILIFKLDVALTLAFPVPFMQDLKFSTSAIGIAQVLGTTATIVGAAAGGALMVRIGIYRSLWTFGLLQGLSGLSYALLAYLGDNSTMMLVAVIVENVCAGMGTVAYTAFLMSICDKHFTATQYALFTSLMALTRIGVGPFAGWLADATGWFNYFLISTVVAAPGLLMLLRYKRWMRPQDAPAQT